jgi:hypothetical protein
MIWQSRGIKMKKKRHYPPSYYRYREKHPTIGVSVNKELKQILDRVRNKVYLFSLVPEYKQYLQSGLVVDNLMNAFEKKNQSFSHNASIALIDGKKWRITDGTREYTIEDFGTELKVYEKMSYSRFISHLLDENSDHLKALKEEYIKGFNKGKKKFRIWVECIHCNKKIPIIPNSEPHKDILEFGKERRWGHPTCHERYNKRKKRV